MSKIINKKQKATNRHWKNFVDKDYLGSHNLEEGEELLVTIEKFVGEEMVIKVGGKQNEKTPKTVLYFKEEVPKMIMNITNGNTISALYGTHPDQWIGKQILIYTIRDKFFGKTQDALRIRDFIPKFNVDISKYVTEMEKAKTLEELKTIWSTFPASARNTESLITKKEEIKSKLQ